MYKLCRISKNPFLTTEQTDRFQGFLPKAQFREGLCKLNRRLMGCTEGLMKSLEGLDSVQLGESPAQEARSHRKSLVDRVQVRNETRRNCDSYRGKIIRLLIMDSRGLAGEVHYNEAS